MTETGTVRVDTSVSSIYLRTASLEERLEVADGMCAMESLCCSTTSCRCSAVSERAMLCFDFVLDGVVPVLSAEDS